MPAPPDHADTRLAKGQQTRERLLEEALRLFALRGSEAVGTRELARAAGTNIASIAFHFGSKEGLYRAVIESVAGELSQIYRIALAEATSDSEAAGEDARQRARRAVAGLTLSLLHANRSQWMSLLLQREFIAPTASFETIYAQAIEPVLVSLVRLVAAATGQGESSLDNTVLAFSLFIVASAFSRNKQTFLRFAGLADYSTEIRAIIGRVVADFAESGLAHRR
jgi:TetR/AcrR family transcriptional regulator, regulator of cefoperazone and chloramphenicol sensitivity